MRFVDIVEDETIREELDELTGLRQRVIIEDREKKLHPHIEIVQDEGRKGKEDPRLRHAGRRAADWSRTAQQIGAGADDRQDHPRGVQDARHHRRSAARGRAVRGAPAEGPGDDLRDRRHRAVRRHQARQARDLRRHVRVQGRSVVVDETQEPQLYEVPAGKHLRVHEGDRVRAGDRLTEGPVNPHDILRIKGPRAVQEYLLNEVQEVYRLQGVKINDKHIGVIVKQMLQKVRVIEPGDTEFLEGEHVDRTGLPRARTTGLTRRAEAGDGRAAAAGHHQGEPDDAVVHLGGELPGDHAGPDRRGDPWRAGRPAGPEGEHHHRSPDPGGHRHVPVPRDRRGRRRRASSRRHRPIRWGSRRPPSPRGTGADSRGVGRGREQGRPGLHPRALAFGSVAGRGHE